MTENEENEGRKRRRVTTRNAERQAQQEEPRDSNEENDEEGVEEETVAPVINPEDELDEIYNRSSSHGEDSESPSPEPAPAHAQPARVRERRAATSARSLILEEVQARVEHANERLRANLLGSLLIEVSDKNEKYLFDWKDPQVRICTVEGKDLPSVDCSLKLSERDLLRIASGDLNPQVAMLSDKVKGQGKLGMAVYFFNLIVQGND